MNEIFLPADTPDGMNAMTAGAMGLNESSADLAAIIRGLSESGMQSDLVTALQEVQQSSHRLAVDIAASWGGLGRGGNQFHEDMHALDNSYGRQARAYVV